MRAAAVAGLDVVALTDHDTAQGWAEATEAAESLGLDLVPGSRSAPASSTRACTCSRTCPTRRTRTWSLALDRVLEGRNARVPAILANLRAAGIELTEDDVRRVPPHSPPTGRPHVADALVARGVVADRAEAFERYLNPGRPGYAEPLRRRPRGRDAAGRRSRRGPRGRAPVGAVGPAGAHRGSVRAAARPRPGRHRGRPPGPRPRRARGPARHRRQPRPGRHRLQRLPRHRQGRPRPGLQHDRARGARPDPRARRERPGRAHDERSGRRHAAGECLRHPLRDHGPGRHRADLPVADRRPVEGLGRGGRPGRRSPSRSW